MIDSYAGSEYIKQYKGTSVDKYIKKDNVYVFQNHDFIPLVHGGHYKPYNQHRIRQPLHEQIHDILNIPYKDHIKFSRKIREATNHRLIQTVEYVDYMIGQQKKYFSKINKLPTETRDLHDVKMFDIVKHWQLVADSMIEYEKMEYPEKFNVMHNHKCKLWRDIAREIQDTLNKKFHFKK